MFSPVIAAELRSRGHDVVAIKEHPEWQGTIDPDAVTSHLVAALEAKLAEYSSDEGLANGETWI